MTKEELIKRFNLRPHREGGHFVEVCSSSIPFNDEQKLYSSILFLLGKNDISHLHVLEEDELWYYQGGDTCTIIDIDENYEVKEFKLGLKEGCYPQYLVKRGHIFGSKYEGDSFTLVGCMVSPSFLYEHFRLVKEEEVLNHIKEEDKKKLIGMFA